jgi:hypothetical protein
VIGEEGRRPWVVKLFHDAESRTAPPARAVTGAGLLTDCNSMPIAVFSTMRERAARVLRPQSD